MSEPDYIVVRAAPDLPPGYLSPQWDGRWIDRSQLPQPPAPGQHPPGFIGVTMTLTPTGRFEVRNHDGAVAEVWEAHPASEPTA